jgi:glutamyl-tRNA synthetase/glutamyl-Q tRNA(Asp) synthetase
MPGKIRFAPSPTGYLHEGHLLSALYVWAAAQKWGLQTHLRIEDHDQGRARPEHIAAIREDLQWLGFHWQSESIQSAHFDTFETVLKKLQTCGLVYPCYCSRKELEEQNPKNQYGEIIYQGHCDGKLPSDAPHSLRLKVPDKVINWHDLRLGDFAENPKLQCGDFTLKDRLGCYTYQFAVCVDDIDEGITHVVRGEDLLPSTARQIALMEILGRTTPPKYLHHPLLVDPSGKKLSKREKSHSIREDRDAGMSPQELLGRVLYKAGFLSSSESAYTSLEKALELVAARL